MPIKKSLPYNPRINHAEQSEVAKLINEQLQLDHKEVNWSNCLIILVVISFVANIGIEFYDDIEYLSMEEANKFKGCVLSFQK